MGVTFQLEAPAVKSKSRPVYASQNFRMHSIHLISGHVFVFARLGQLSDDEMTLAIFNVYQMEWSWVKIAGPEVPYSWCHASCLFSDSIYVFGGTNQWDLCSNEVFRLDLTMLEWCKVDVGEMQPERRKFHTGEFIERKKQFVCFGGFGAQLAATSYFPDVWVLDQNPCAGVSRN